MSERTTSACEHKFAATNCKKCGIYSHSADPALKTNLYESCLNASASKYLRHMRKRQNEVLDFKEISDSTFTLLQSICQKFEYTIETLALGLYIYARTYQKEEKDEKFWASAALIVASKGIELDKRVPYLNRYQRYADKSFSQEDYELAEKTIFQQINFDIQYSTFVSFLHFYLTNGVVFKSDSFFIGSLRYVEDDIMTRAKDYLKTGEFLSHHPQKLALSIIREVRAKFRMEPWKKQLTLLSGYESEQIPSTEKTSILRPLNGLICRNKERFVNVGINSATLSSLQNSLNMTEQKIRSSKKRLEQTLKAQNVKQNSNKTMVSQLPLAALRSQVMSVNKYGNLAVSSEKVVPLSSFISRRA